jgi:hypothetical protein
MVEPAIIRKAFFLTFFLPFLLILTLLSTTTVNKNNNYEAARHVVPCAESDPDLSKNWET